MSLRYAFVAAFCAGLHNLVIIGLDALGLHYAVSSLASFAIVLSVGFALHCGFTFEASPSVASLLRYAGAMSVNLPLSVAALYLTYDLAALPMTLASPVATIMLFVLNFFLSSWAIQRSSAEEAPQEPKRL